MPRDGAAPMWVMPWNTEGLSNEAVRRSVEYSSMARGEWAPQQGQTPWRRRRRTAIAVSLVGLAGALLAAWLDSGVMCRSVPAARRRASRRPVVPEGMQSAAFHALALLCAGEPTKQPWKPALAAGAAAAGTGAAVQGLSRPRSRAGAARAACVLVDVLSHLAAFTLALGAAADAAPRHAGLSEA